MGSLPKRADSPARTMNRLLEDGECTIFARVSNIHVLIFHIYIDRFDYHEFI